MWKAVYVSDRGTAHKADRSPCQDVCRVRQVESVLIAVCADGAGSASHAHIGADLACWCFVEHLSAVAQSGKVRDGVTREDAIGWCQIIRDALTRRAERLQVPVRDLACTLLGAVVGDSSAVFLQIGDGAMVVSEGHGYETVFWPQSGEYANTTNFLTDPEFERSLEFSVRIGPITEVAAFTDGLERLILRFADRTVHSPFLQPMFTAMRSAAEMGDYFKALRRFLHSERVNERTNDDKTLILAVRDEDRSDAKETVS